MTEPEGAAPQHQAAGEVDDQEGLVAASEPLSQIADRYSQLSSDNSTRETNSRLYDVPLEPKIYLFEAKEKEVAIIALARNSGKFVPSCTAPYIRI